MGNLGLTPSEPLEPAALALNLLISGLLAYILGKHFLYFGSTFSNRNKFAYVLAPIALTTCLVISVVKASLALSLGLVGALSIVRFRTPVKEPEELAYLFMAIAIGLGFGADQRWPTIIAFALILGLLALRAALQKGSAYPNLYLNIEMAEPHDDGAPLGELLELLTEYVETVDLRRLDIANNTMAATVYLDCKNADKLVAVQKALEAKYPNASVTFVEQSGMPGV